MERDTKIIKEYRIVKRTIYENLGYICGLIDIFAINLCKKRHS